MAYNASGSTSESAINQITSNADVALQVAMTAYVFFYPIITMDVTRRQSVNNPKWPMNVMRNLLAFPTATLTTVVRPNFDTLYSTAWLDVTNEPIILSVPDTNGRYYLMPLLDMWTDVFAVPGWRTTGTAAADFVIVPPGWSGSLPAGLIRIDAPTPYVWLIGRTQTNGVEDYTAVNALQEQYTLTRLSEWNGVRTPFAAPIDASVNMTSNPLQQVNSMSASVFFSYAASLLKLHPAHATDWSVLATFAKIGIVPGQDLHWDALPQLVKTAMENAVTKGLASIRTLGNNGKKTNGWLLYLNNVGVYGNSYLARAFTAMVGLGANQPQDALYPLLVTDSNDQVPDGSRNYKLTFPADALPPVDAFWSITMYDAAGYAVSNPLNRYALHSWDPLQFNSDGSLTIYMQHSLTSDVIESNWLPTPSSGALGVTLRLYAPSTAAQLGSWSPPPVVPTA